MRGSCSCSASRSRTCRRSCDPLVGHPHVAVGQPRIAEGVEQGRKLVGMPAVVLVGEGDESRLARRHRKRSLEVAVEAEPLRGARDREARIVSGQRAQVPEASHGRPAVADHAHRAAGLIAKRCDLAFQQRGLGIERAMQIATITAGCARGGASGRGTSG